MKSIPKRITLEDAELELMNEVAKERYGGSLFDYQRDLFWRMLKFEFNIVLKSRQLGISDFISGYALFQALQGEVWIIVSPSLRQSGNIIFYAEKWLDGLRQSIPDIDTKIKSSNKSEIIFKNGGGIISLPNSESTSRGLSADGIIFDEFAFFLHGTDERIWGSLLPSLSTKVKKRLVIISTANGEGNLFYKMYKDYFNFPDFQRVFYHYSEHPFMDIENIKRNLDSLSWEQEFEGKFLTNIGSYFPYGLLRDCIDTESEYMSLEQLKYIQTPLYCGIDIGKRIDFTAITIVSPIGDKLKVVYKKVLKTEAEKEWNNQYALIQQILDTGKINRMYIDSAGIGDQIADEFSKKSHQVIKFNFTNQNKAVMFPNFKKKLEDRIIEYPNDSELVNTLHMIERTQQGNTVVYGTDKRTDEYGHQDLAISLILACYCYDMESSDSQFYRRDKLDLMFKEFTSEVNSPYFIGISNVITITRENSNKEMIVEDIIKTEFDKILFELKKLPKQNSKVVSVDLSGTHQNVYELLVNNLNSFENLTVLGYNGNKEAIRKDKYTNLTAELSDKLYDLIEEGRIKSIKHADLEFELKQIRETIDAQGRLKIEDIEIITPIHFFSLLLAVNSWTSGSYDYSIGSGGWG